MRAKNAPKISRPITNGLTASSPRTPPRSHLTTRSRQPARAPTPPPADLRYIIQPGDTLSGIGARFGIDWQTVYSANHAVIGNDANRLIPGEKLTIPSVSPNQPPPYIVQRGDTLSGIAARFGIDWQTVYSANPP